MGSNGKKTILITGDLHARLADMGKKGDTFSDIIEKALDTIEALQNRAIEEGELN
jgi:predicted CopG family antitoxin|tara:strand:- start:3522 stop:3686 length:165 start_codon:yes stop_codon:yes gene_type:complete